MTTDSFWKIFWVSTSGIFLVSLVVSVSIFVYSVSNVDASAIGATFDGTKDPFQLGLYKSGSFALVNGVVYRDAFPLRLEQWGWDSKVGWSSSEEVYSDTASIKIQFLKEWAGMGLSGFTAPVTSYTSISFAVRPDTLVGDLYISVYDDKRNALPRQSIGFYAKDGALVPNTWQVITIPLKNLFGGQTPTALSAISISTTNPGTAFVDDITFGKDPVEHAVWVQPEWVPSPPFNPFATSTPVFLPYVLEFTESQKDRWYSYFGFMEFKNNGLQIGPSAPNFNDSLVVFRSGNTWADYQIEVTVDWGLTSTFSLLARVQDPLNYTSCAYSYYGQTVQMYQVTNGVSRQLGQSPGLPTKYDAPWAGMKASMKVQGKIVTCYADGEKVLSYDIPDMPARGTVGFEAWDKNTYASPHTIRSFEVRPLMRE